MRAGPGSPNWVAAEAQGAAVRAAGWANSTRKSRLPADWARRRAAVLARDGHRCRALDSAGARCRATANQVDHIVAGDEHALANLQALCAFHHAKKTSAEGRAAQKPRATRAREPERHPGLLD